MEKSWRLQKQNMGQWVGPVLISISEKDQVIQKQDQEWMIEKTPPSKVETIFGSDHMVMTFQPDQLLAHLLAIAS